MKIAKRVRAVLIIVLALCCVFFFNRSRHKPEVILPDWNSVFRGIPTKLVPELVPHANRLKVLVGKHGIPEMIRQVDENGFDDGWVLKFSAHGISEDGPFHVTLEEARQMRGSEYHGYFFRWEVLSGGCGPASFGRWKRGQPFWGKFLVTKVQENPRPEPAGMSMAESSPADRYVEINFGDAATHYTYFQDAKEIACVGELNRLDKQFQLALEADPDFAAAASEIRSIGEEYLQYRLRRMEE